MYPGIRPKPEERYFSYAGADFWTWIPSSWVHEGTVVVANDGRFWELTRHDREGWWALELRPEEVGKPELLARIKVARIALEAAAPDSAPGGRHAELREDLVRLCNARLPAAYEPSSIPRGRWWAKKETVGICAAFFVLSLGAAIVRIQTIPWARHDAYVLLAVTLSTLFFGSFVLTLALYVLARYPEKVRSFVIFHGPSGELMGALALGGLAVLIAAVVWFLFTVNIGAGLLHSY